MVKIAIAARGLTSEHKGPNELIYGLIQGLLKYWSSIDLHIYYDNCVKTTIFPDATEHMLPVKNRLLWDHVLFPLAAKKHSIDFVIFPKGPVPLWNPYSFGAFILDLGYFHREIQAYKTLDTWYMKFILPYAVKKADVVWTISHHTRKDVIEILGVNPDKVHVAYLAPNDRYSRIKDANLLENVARKYLLRFPFIFYPTSISPRKNIERLLRAFKKVQHKIPHHLYLTGGIGWNNEEVVDMLRDRVLSQRVHLLGKVEPDEMPVLYTLSDFTTYVSLFEGFGLPVIEAFRCGSPVLISDQTSLPEIAQNAALMVDAYDENSIAQGLYEMATNADLRKRLVLLGYEQANQFTWEKTISQIKQDILANI